MRYLLFVSPGRQEARGRDFVKSFPTEMEAKTWWREHRSTEHAEIWTFDGFDLKFVTSTILLPQPSHAHH